MDHPYYVQPFEELTIFHVMFPLPKFHNFGVIAKLVLVFANLVSLTSWLSYCSDEGKNFWEQH